MLCRSCGSKNLWTFLDLGNQAIPRFPKSLVEKVPHFPLELAKCEDCHLVQLSESVDRELLFRKFWYQSGISSTIRSDLEKIAGEGRIQVSELKHGDVVVDIGCNDGTLLGFFDESVNRVGFEPAINMAKLARQNGSRIVEDYFSAQAFHKVAFYQAKLVFAIAMFYDLENPVRFCQEVSECLEANGVFVVQQNYLGLMLKNTAYDNICHEHLTYFSLASLKKVLEKTDLEVYHVELNEINGGSMKTFIAHKGARTVDSTVAMVDQDEIEQNLEGKTVYQEFLYRVRSNARRLNRSLEPSQGKKTMIYGAGTRGATLFQFASMFHRPEIVGAVDNNPDKQGHYYIDTGIPIISRLGTLKNPPDYFLVLPYHIADEIIQKEKEAFPKTNWIIPLPEFRIV